MAKYHIKKGVLSSKKWKYAPRFRSKYRRGAASLILRKYIYLRRRLDTALVVVESDTPGSRILNTNTSIEEKSFLYQKIPKSHFKETFRMRFNNIKFPFLKYKDKKVILLSRIMPKSNIKEALQTLGNNISINASKHNGTKRTIFSYIQPKSAIAEAFRTLRTNISFSAFKGSNKVILITSPGAEEGKSTVVTNLAVVMAQAQNRVLIVECDLRKPVMHNSFGLDNVSGLTNLLVQDLQPKDVVCETEVEGLYVIASGPIPPNPSELLGSAKMAVFLSEVAEQYDVVLLDSPPVIAVTDAVLLAPMVDSVLLVLKAGETRFDMAKEAKERLMNAGHKSIGVVLNEAKQRGSSYNNYNYY